MANSVESFASRLANDEYFLAYALNAYALSEQVDDSGLARALGCNVEILDSLRLCRMPGSEPKLFQRDVDRIASHFGVDADVLAQVVRRSDVLVALRRGAGNDGGLMMAARNRSEENPKTDSPSDHPT